MYQSQSQLHRVRVTVTFLSVDINQTHDNSNETSRIRLPCGSVTNSWSFSTISKTNFRREGVKLRGKLLTDC